MYLEATATTIVVISKNTRVITPSVASVCSIFALLLKRQDDLRSCRDIIAGYGTAVECGEKCGEKCGVGRGGFKRRGFGGLARKEGNSSLRSE